MKTDAETIISYALRYNAFNQAIDCGDVEGVRLWGELCQDMQRTHDVAWLVTDAEIRRGVIIAQGKAEGVKDDNTVLEQALQDNAALRERINKLRDILG